MTSLASQSITVTTDITKAEADVDKLKSDIQSISNDFIEIHFDTSKVNGDIDNLTEKADAKSIENPIDIHFDKTKVDNDLDGIFEQVKTPLDLEIRFVGSKTTTDTAETATNNALEVKISTTEADTKLNNTNQLLTDIQAAADPIRVDADTTAAHKELNDLMADIAALRPTVKVGVDITADATEIQILVEEAVANAIRNASI
jgi:hypothetical protein